MSNKKNDLATVIIPTYNRAKWIRKTLESVYNQSYRPIELIVVDDGSIDNTQELINEWSIEKDDDVFSTRYIYQKNSGAPNARNQGLENAKGKYIQFFDSDDLLMPEKLQFQIDLMKLEKTPLCICDYSHVDKNGNTIRVNMNDRSIYEIIRGFNGQHTSIGVFEKEFLQKYKLRWNPEISKRQDTDFYTRTFMILPSFSYANKILFEWIRDEKDGITNTIHFDNNIYRNLLKSSSMFYFKNFQKIPVRRTFSIFYYHMFLLYKWMVR